MLWSYNFKIKLAIGLEETNKEKLIENDEWFKTFEKIFVTPEMIEFLRNEIVEAKTTKLKTKKSYQDRLDTLDRAEIEL